MGANILVIDDSPTFAGILQGILKASGHKVDISNDGMDVFDILSRKRIGVILLDVVMPRTDGFEILRKLQEHEIWCNIPVLLVTGQRSPEDVKRGLDMGATDYIKKPCEEIEIVARVNAALRLKEKHDMLMEFATTDSLTKLHNRLSIDSQLNRMVEHISEWEKGISFIIADCDFFKRINDTYGHPAGDKVLAKVALTIRRTVKNIDLVGRYGGEEFCVILPDTLQEEAALAAERIRSNIAKLEFNLNGDKVGITVSLGISHMPKNSGITAMELIADADRALYRAKEKGRNRIELS